MNAQLRPGTDICAADLQADSEVPPDAPVASSDPDAFIDDGLGMGDGPDLQAPAEAAADAADTH